MNNISKTFKINKKNEFVLNKISIQKNNAILRNLFSTNIGSICWIIINLLINRWHWLTCFRIFITK